jgi:hypothetical protein
MKQILSLPIFFSLLFISALAQSNGPLATTSNVKAIAGVYVVGNGFVGNVYKLSDDGSFEFYTWSDCCDPVWRQSGTYSFKDDQLHFKISKKTLGQYNLLDPKQAAEAYRKLYHEEKADVKPGDIQTEYDMYVSKWGERFYLIEPGRLHQFAAAVNFGVEPRLGKTNKNLLLLLGIYLRRGDETKPVSGKPSLPEPFRPFLQDVPLKASITKNESQGKDRIYVIDKGSAGGVKIGMSFVGENVEPDYDNLLWVTSVEAKSAKVQSYYNFRPYDYQLKAPLTTKLLKKS